MAEELREAERPALTRLAGPYEDFFLRLDRFTPEQRDRYDRLVRIKREIDARLEIFNNYIKSHASAEAIQQYENKSLNDFHDVMISCSCLSLDKDGNFKDYSAMIGPSEGFVKMPMEKREMPYHEYGEFYTKALDIVLTKITGFDPETAAKHIEAACTEIYLPKQTEEMSR